MKKIRVLTVEDHSMTRLGLRIALEKSENIEIAGEASDGVTAVDIAVKEKPDVILMDIGLPYMDGITATEKIKEALPNTRILIYTSRENDEDVFSALSAGADGYIMKGTEADKLISALTAVAEGTAWLDPAIARLVLSNVNAGSKNVAVKSEATDEFNLTAKECEVLGLIVEGLDNEQIADKLCVAISTAKAHVHNILQKLYVKNKHEATVKALKKGLVR